VIRDNRDEQPLKYRQLVVESLSANATEQNHSISLRVQHVDVNPLNPLNPTAQRPALHWQTEAHVFQLLESLCRIRQNGGRMSCSVGGALFLRFSVSALLRWSESARVSDRLLGWPKVRPLMVT
jgi:hypothetical protein